MIGIAYFFSDLSLGKDSSYYFATLFSSKTELLDARAVVASKLKRRNKKLMKLIIFALGFEKRIILSQPSRCL